MIIFKSIQRIDLIVNGKVYSKFKFVLLDNSIMLLTPQQFEEMKARNYGLSRARQQNLSFYVVDRVSDIIKDSKTHKEMIKN